MVEYTDEYTIRLSVHFRQFDGYQFHFLEYPCRKEVRVGIKAVDNLTFIAFYDRFQLECIADKQQLFAAKGFTHIMGVNPQNLINEINDIGPYHGNLINNDEFNVVKQLAMVGRIFQKTMQFSSFQTEIRIIGQ